MTHASCPDCRLRFTPAAAAYLQSCPSCGAPLQSMDGLAGAVGFRLFGPDEATDSAPHAVAVSMPAPDAGLGPS